VGDRARGREVVKGMVAIRGVIRGRELVEVVVRRRDRGRVRVRVMRQRW
jgi:hypothetical protein